MNAERQKARTMIRPTILALEQRFMFDGAAVADAVDHAANSGDSVSDSGHDAPAPVTVREVDPALNDGKKEVAFVDTSVADYQTLVDGVRAGVEVVLIDGGESGLDQMAQWAETHSGYDAIHILSHGAEGSLTIGTDTVTTATLADSGVQADLTALGAALSADGDLLLYGCSVGAGESGQALVAQLADITGADVAASDDATGAAILGGDWSFEATVGDIDGVTLGLDAYGSVLGNITMSPGTTAGTSGADVFVLAAGGGFDTGTATNNTLPAEDVLSNVTNIVTNFQAETDRFSFTAYGLDISTFTFEAQSQFYSYDNPARGGDAGAVNLVIVTPAKESGGAASVTATTGTDGTMAVVYDADGFALYNIFIAGVTYTDLALTNFYVPTTTTATNDTAAATEAGGVSDGTASTNPTGNVLTNDYFATSVSSFRTGNTEGAGTAGVVGQALTGTYGSLTLNSNGTYTYTVDNSNPTVAALAAGATLHDYFNYTTTDGTNSDSGVLNVTITGTNDAPVLSTPSAGSYTDTTAADTFTNTTGTLSATDTDTGATKTYGISGGSSGSYLAAAYDRSLAGLYGTLYVNSTSGAYAYVPNAASVNAITSGASPTDTFTVTVSDGTLTDSKTYTVNFSGADDVPTASGVPASVTVTEDTASNVDLSAITLADVDTAGNITVTIAAGAGSLAATSGGSVTVGGSGTGTLTLTGTAANIDTFLNTASNIQYTGASNASGNGATSLTITANDGGAGGTVTLGTVSVNITAVNDAPTASGTYTFTTTNEDTTTTGVTVATILAGLTAADADGDTLGLAVNGTTGNGTWQFSTDSTNGSDGTWTSFAASQTPSATNSLLLSPATYVRYVPDSQNGETATITVRAWDQSAGTASSGATARYADTQTNGNATAYSSTTASGSLSVSAVNDAPSAVADADNSSSAGSGNFATAFSSGGSAVAVVDSDFTITDVDNANMASAVITLTGNTDAGESLTISGTPATSNGITITYTSATQITLSGSATKAAYETVIKTILYQNTNAAGATTAGSRTVTVTVNDGTAADATPPTTTISVVAAPIIDLDGTAAGTGKTASFTEDGGAVSIVAADATVTDGDSANLNQLVIQITNAQSGDVIKVGSRTTGDVVNGITITYDSASQITLSGVATKADYLALVKEVTFNNTSDTPNTTDRTVTFTGRDTDGHTGSAATATVSVAAVNDAPAFAGLDATPNPNENVAIVLDANATLSDAELDAADNYNGATLTLARNGGANANDTFGNTGTLGALTAGGSLTVGATTIGTVTTNSAGTLVLTFNANATAALVDSVLQQITYTNASDTESGAITINFTFSDGTTVSQGSGGAKTATGSITVTVAAVNDAPSFSGLDGTPSFTKGGSAVVLDANATVADVELDAGNNYNGATLTLVRNGGANANDLFSGSGTLLGAADSATLTEGGALKIGTTTIGTVTTNSAGTLVLTFNANATAALVDSAIQQIAYRADTAQTAGNVQVNWTFSDGTTVSQGSGGAKTATGSVTVAVANAAPVVGGLGGDTVSGTPGTTLDFDTGGNATVTDADSTDFRQGYITITGTGSLSGVSFSLDGTTAASGGDATITAGETVTVNGVVIGTVHAVSDGQGGNALRIDFSNDANPTPARIEALLRSLKLTSTGDASGSYSVQIVDGAGSPATSTAMTVTVSIATAATESSGNNGSSASAQGGDTGTTSPTTTPPVSTAPVAPLVTVLRDTGTATDTTGTTGDTGTSGTTFSSPTQTSGGTQGGTTGTTTTTGGGDTGYKVPTVSAGAGQGDALVVVKPVMVVDSTGPQVNFTLPSDTFASTEADARVQLSASQLDGAALPGWLAFNPQTGTFVGQPPPGVTGEVVVRVIARDQAGREAIATIRINVGGGVPQGQGQPGQGQPGPGQGEGQGQPQGEGQPQGGGAPGQSGDASPDLGETTIKLADGDMGTPVGKPSFQNELSMAGRLSGVRQAQLLAAARAVARHG